MTRNLRRRAAACLCAGLVTLLVAPLAGPARAAEEPPEGGDPLQVSIDKVTPSVIPDRGRLRLSGVVTNTTDSTWTDLKVYLLTSAAPMRSEAELATADGLDPYAYLGDRLAKPGQFISISDLAPGESTRFAISRPRDELEISGQPGVYWVGVQVLGADETGRIDGADGRARTLVPLMRVKNPPAATLALALPFRGRVAYDDEGRALTVDEWHRALGQHGRLGRLLDLSESAGSFPLSWVLDPALIDLFRDLAADNPGFDLGPTDGESPSPTATASPDEGDDASEEPSAEAEAAARYLDEFRAEAGDRDVLALPYGDVDVAGAYTWAEGSVVEDALDFSENRLDDLEVDSTPVVDPPDGTLPWSALEELPIEVPVLLDDTAVDGDTSRVDVDGGPRITRLDSSAVPATGGALDVRQRILAEVAVRALSRSPADPVVVQLPDRWDPGAGWQRARFFEGLDVPWLDPVDASSVLRSTTLGSIEPRSEALHEVEDAPAVLPAANFVASRNLKQSGHVLDVLLPRNDRIADVVAGLSYLGISGQFRDVPGRALDRTVDLDRALRDLLDQVTLTGPTFVTMSSEDGEFQVTIVNGLDEPVSVGVEARVNTQEISIPPTEPITIPAGQRRSVRMKASTSRIGVWPVQLEAVNSEGDTISDGEDLNVRSSHVGQFVWGSLGVGTLVLLVLIVFRVRRKVRLRQATPGPLLPREEA